VADATTPGEFDPIFRQGVPIVGGHAVNLWATYYSPRGDNELREFAPFISKDGDIYLKDPQIAQAVATAAGWRFEKNPEARSAVLGRIVLEKGGVRLDVHVMRSVNGLSEADLAKTESLNLQSGTTYCLPAPDVMLKAKLSNLDTIEQKERARQDERHVRMMILCNRHYLLDSVQAVRAGQLAEREAVDRFSATHRVTNSAMARRLDQKHGLKLTAAIPARDALGDISAFRKLSAFYDHQVHKSGQRERA